MFRFQSENQYPKSLLKTIAPFSWNTYWTESYFFEWLVILNVFPISILLNRLRKLMIKFEGKGVYS